MAVYYGKMFAEAVGLDPATYKRLQKENKTDYQPYDWYHGHKAQMLASGVPPSLVDLNLDWISSYVAREDIDMTVYWQLIMQQIPIEFSFTEENFIAFSDQEPVPGQALLYDVQDAYRVPPHTEVETTQTFWDPSLGATTTREVSYRYFPLPLDSLQLLPDGGYTSHVAYPISGEASNSGRYASADDLHLPHKAFSTMMQSPNMVTKLINLELHYKLARWRTTKRGLSGDHAHFMSLPRKEQRREMRLLREQPASKLLLSASARISRAIKDREQLVQNSVESKGALPAYLGRARETFSNAAGGETTKVRPDGEPFAVKPPGERVAEDATFWESAFEWITDQWQLNDQALTEQVHYAFTEDYAMSAWPTAEDVNSTEGRAFRATNPAANPGAPNCFVGPEKAAETFPSDVNLQDRVLRHIAQFLQNAVSASGLDPTDASNHGALDDALQMAYGELDAQLTEGLGVLWVSPTVPKEEVYTVEKMGRKTRAIFFVSRCINFMTKFIQQGLTAGRMEMAPEDDLGGGSFCLDGLNHHEEMLFRFAGELFSRAEAGSPPLAGYADNLYMVSTQPARDFGKKAVARARAVGLDPDATHVVFSLDGVSWESQVTPERTQAFGDWVAGRFELALRRGALEGNERMHLAPEREYVMRSFLRLFATNARGLIDETQTTVAQQMSGGTLTFILNQFVMTLAGYVLASSGCPMHPFAPEFNDVLEDHGFRLTYEAHVDMRALGAALTTVKPKAKEVYFDLLGFNGTVLTARSVTHDLAYRDLATRVAGLPRPSKAYEERLAVNKAAFEACLEMQNTIIDANPALRNALGLADGELSSNLLVPKLAKDRTVASWTFRGWMRTYDGYEPRGALEKLSALADSQREYVAALYTAFLNGVAVEDSLIMQFTVEYGRASRSVPDGAQVEVETFERRDIVVIDGLPSLAHYLEFWNRTAFTAQREREMEERIKEEEEFLAELAERAGVSEEDDFDVKWGDISYDDEEEAVRPVPLAPTSTRKAPQIAREARKIKRERAKAAKKAAKKRDKRDAAALKKAERARAREKAEKARAQAPKSPGPKKKRGRKRPADPGLGKYVTFEAPVKGAKALTGKARRKRQRQKAAAEHDVARLAVTRLTGMDGREVVIHDDKPFKLEWVPALSGVTKAQDLGSLAARFTDLDKFRMELDLSWEELALAWPGN